ncbi:MAG: DUF2089-like zinc ribbon domain-containing protein, partial [Limisphaerales bacterium]
MTAESRVEKNRFQTPFCSSRNNLCEYSNLLLYCFTLLTHSIVLLSLCCMKRLPTSCPSCGGFLAVKRLHCESCETEVEGFYALPVLA